jgi:hypothetical protein
MKIQRASTNGRTRVRAGLFAGIFAGILTGIFFAFLRPNPPITFDVFYFAAKQSLSGPIVYETVYGLWTYTPASLLYFYPYALLFDFETALTIHRLMSVFVSISFGYVLTAFIQRHEHMERIDRLAVFLFSIASVYPIVNVINGSFVGVFAMLLGAGWLLMESKRHSGGALWALASITKGYPAFWGVYMVRIRNWRAVLAAVVTGMVSTVIGLLVFGIDAYVRFFTVAGRSRVRYEQFRGGASPDNEAVTPLRALGQLFPQIDPAIWTPVILVVIVVLTIFAYYAIPADSLNNRATLLLVTVLGVWFIMPTSQDLDIYILYAPLLVLLFAERERLVQSLYVAGTVFVSYNFGRGELRAVSELFGVSNLVMPIGDPVLSFATMPMYGITMLYIGCLGKAWACFTE